MKNAANPFEKASGVSKLSSLLIEHQLRQNNLYLSNSHEGYFHSDINQLKKCEIPQKKNNKNSFKVASEVSKLSSSSVEDQLHQNNLYLINSHEEYFLFDGN